MKAVAIMSGGMDSVTLAYYLKQTKLKHPRYEEIINHYPTKYDEVVNYLINKIPKDKKIWYQ